MKKLAFLVLLVVMLVLPTAALADGATTSTTPYSFENCYNVTGPGYGICYEDRGVLHRTATPSGNYQFTQNGNSIVEYYFDGSVYYSREFDYHRVYLAQDGSAQVNSSRYSNTYTYADGTTCTWEYDYHWANGELRRYDYGYVCS